jgi:hypothetical protein
MVEAIRSSETSVLTRTTRRNFPQDAMKLYQTSIYSQYGHKMSQITRFTMQIASPTVKETEAIET